MSKSLEKATFGAGCFWCVEAIFQSLKGVEEVASGYSGGELENPTYKQVCAGNTGHAEVCQITYDANTIAFSELLEAFWQAHDPTQLNRQGNDVGTQYRSVIFYHNEEQKKIAEEQKAQLSQEKVFPNPIVTEISPLINYYPAEDYHNNYFELHGEESYCSFVVKPKVDKFKKAFKSKLKS